MNDSFTIQKMDVTPVSLHISLGVHSADTSHAQQPPYGGRLSSEEIAKKVMKLTGSVRLASRSAHHWHHCGINE